MDIPARLRDLLTPILSNDNMEKVRGFVEENAKLYLNTENTTINLWPPLIICTLALLVLLPALPYILNSYSYLLGKGSGHHHRTDYEDYEDDQEYNYDNSYNSYSQFRKRRRGPGKRARLNDEEYLNYSEDWRNTDNYWDKQTRELQSGEQNSMASMVVGLADSVSNAVKLIN